ncbi:hypothetical protein M0R45_021740 [Rubus argutus]|uniref:Uncharacterized protein n=1 Tax=Rubus argutus TaxID=59490 RepID=A0AAW1XFA1_RUBAR
MLREGIGAFRSLLVSTKRSCQGDHEAEEVFAGIGVVEAANVVGGLDFLEGVWKLKGERLGGDRLGLRNRGEDYGLLGVVVWREI